jgi:hypothetical protein
MIQPVVREVVVPVSSAEAFRRFTVEMATWWPTDTHSVHLGRCEGVVFEEGVGGRIYERAADATAEWGRVSRWEPPHLVAFSWHPGRPRSTA